MDNVCDNFTSQQPLTETYHLNSESEKNMLVTILFFWVTMPNELVDRYKCFRVTYCLELQPRTRQPTVKRKILQKILACSYE